MKRNLLTQIKNEWRDNIWMILELTVVTGIIWLICLFTYVSTKDYFLPRGFEYENVYTLKGNTVPKSSSYYITPPEDEEKPWQTDLQEIVRRLNENPNVVSAAIETNALPYNYNFAGRNIYLLNENDTVGYNGNTRRGTPEIITVLGYESATGKTRQQLEDMLRRGEILVSDRNQAYEESGMDVMKLIGASVIFGTDSSKVYRVGDVIRKVRRNDYEDSWGGTIVMPKTETGLWGDVVVKIHPGHDAKFKEDFANNPELRRQRNVYLSDLTSLSDRRESAQRRQVTTLNTIVCLLVFLLATIFLGLLGTFWFRMQQRTGEIALRKVCGATSADIFRRVIGEGMILLLMAVILTSAILWPLSGTITQMFWCSRLTYFIFELVAVAIVALGIVVSLWYPARKAMDVEPAIALKSE